MTDVSLGPAITRVIQESRANVVESPSAGYIRVSEPTSTFVTFALQLMLSVALARSSTRVWVRCSIDHLRVLRLELLDNGLPYLREDNHKFAEVKEHLQDMPHPFRITYFQEGGAEGIVLTVHLAE